jgi:hypothetical protein
VENDQIQQFERWQDSTAVIHEPPARKAGLNLKIKRLPGCADEIRKLHAK